MRLLNAECIIAPSAILEETKKELDEYFAGKRHTFEIPLHPPQNLLDSYYEEKPQKYHDRTEEADKVSIRIAKILSENAGSQNITSLPLRTR